MAVQREDDNDQVDQSKTGFFIDLAPELLERIKEAAVRRDLSLQEYVRRVLERDVSSEADIDEVRGRQQWKPINRAAVDRLFQFREELKRAHPGIVFEDSTELLRQAREERTRELEQRSGTP
jgi:hypothetical protein